VVDALAGYQGPPFRVTEVELVRSHLGPDPRHEPVAAWSLLG
jgi:2'-5' RNA ligase